MSITDRAKGLRARRRNQGGVLIDLTPLIDVVFQLLIFFILTTTFENNPAFRVKLPKANNADVKQEPKAVVVTVTSDGKITDDATPLSRSACATRRIPTTPPASTSAPTQPPSTSSWSR